MSMSSQSLKLPSLVKYLRTKIFAIIILAVLKCPPTKETLVFYCRQYYFRQFISLAVAANILDFTVLDEFFFLYNHQSP
jgi:hypothetical protein